MILEIIKANDSKQNEEISDIREISISADPQHKLILDLLFFDDRSEQIEINDNFKRINMIND